MQKRRFLVIALLNLIISVLCFAGCSIGFVLVEKIEPKNSETIEMTMGNFDCSNISLIVSYSDNTTEEVPLEMDMIPTEEQMKFYKEGEQSIKVIYRDRACYLNVNVIRNTFDDISLVDERVVYDGKVHSLSFSSYIPENANVIYPNGNSFTDVGEYEVKAIINCVGYETTEAFGTLVIEKATYDMSKVIVEDKSFTYDGMSKSFVPENLPDGVKVNVLYYSADGKTQINAPSLVGEYLERIRFVSSNLNYNSIPDKTIKLTVTKACYNIGDLQFNDDKVDYNGQSHFIKIKNTVAIPKEVNVNYEYYYLGAINETTFNVADLTEDMLVEEPINAGTYIAKALLTSSNVNYEEINPIYAKLIIKPMEVSLSHVKVNSSIIDFDNDTHAVGLIGNLPSSVGVKYTYNGEEVEGVRRIGTYKIVASFYFLEETANTVLVPSSVTGNLVINKTSGTIDATPVIVYNDDANAEEDKYTIEGIPEDVNYTVKFTQNDEVVLANELSRGNVYEYTISYNYKDEVRNEGVKLASKTGSVNFRYIVRLESISMEDKYFIGSDTQQSSFSIYAQATGEDIPDDLFIYVNNEQKEMGEYTVTASLNEEKYEVRWDTVGEHPSKFSAKMYIITDPFSVTLESSNIVYVDSKDILVDKYKIQGFDLSYYKINLTFIEDTTEESVLGTELQRNVVYRYRAKINIQNEEIDKLGDIPVFEGKVIFKVLLEVGNIPVTDTNLTYNGAYQDVKVTNTTLPDDAYVYYLNGNKSVGKLSVKNVGEYNVTVRYNTDVYDFNYAAGANSFKDIKVTVAKMIYSLPESFVSNDTIVYDGKDHYVTPNYSLLPSNITVKLQYVFKFVDANTGTEKEFIESGIRRVGTYEVTATAQTDDSMIDVSQAVQKYSIEVTFDLKNRVDYQFVYNYTEDGSAVSKYLQFEDEYYHLSFKSQTSKSRVCNVDVTETETFRVDSQNDDFIIYDGTWIDISYTLTKNSASKLTIVSKEESKFITLATLIKNETIIYDGLTHEITYDYTKVPNGVSIAITYSFEYTDVNGNKKTITTDTSVHRLGTYKISLVASANDENTYLYNSLQSCTVEVKGVTLEDIQYRVRDRFVARSTSSSIVSTEKSTLVFKDKLLGLTFTSENVVHVTGLSSSTEQEYFTIKSDNEDFIAYNGVKLKLYYKLLSYGNSGSEVLEIGQNGKIIPVNGNFVSNETIIYDGNEHEVTIDNSLFTDVNTVKFNVVYFLDDIAHESIKKVGNYTVNVRATSTDPDVFYSNGYQTCTVVNKLCRNFGASVSDQLAYLKARTSSRLLIKPQTTSQKLVFKDLTYGITYTSKEASVHTLASGYKYFSETFIISTTNEDLSMFNGLEITLTYMISAYSSATEQTQFSRTMGEA